MDKENEDIVSERDHDSSKPPPPPSRPQSLPEYAVDKAAEAKLMSRQALAVATEARDTGRQLVAMMGASPDPVRKIEGSGVLGGVTQILDRLEAIEATNAKWAQLRSVALGALGVVATVVGIIKALGGGH